MQKYVVFFFYNTAYLFNYTYTINEELTFKCRNTDTDCRILMYSEDEY